MSFCHRVIEPRDQLDGGARQRGTTKGALQNIDTDIVLADKKQHVHRVRRPVGDLRRVADEARRTAKTISKMVKPLAQPEFALREFENHI